MAILLQFHLSFAADGGFSHVPADRPGIGFGALSANRQFSRVPCSAVTLNLFQASDVLTDNLPQFSLDLAVFLDKILQEAHLSLIQIFGSLVRIDLGFLENPFGNCRSDSVNISKRHLDALFVRNIYAYQSHLTILVSAYVLEFFCKPHKSALGGGQSCNPYKFFSPMV